MLSLKNTVGVQFHRLSGLLYRGAVQLITCQLMMRHIWNIPRKHKVGECLSAIWVEANEVSVYWAAYVDGIKLSLGQRRIKLNAIWYIRTPVPTRLVPCQTVLWRSAQVFSPLFYSSPCYKRPNLREMLQLIISWHKPPWVSLIWR